MPRKERIRESLDALPTPEYLMRRIELGWRPAAIEWERDIPEERPGGGLWSEEIPYGLQLAPDGAGLVENPWEREVITAALDMIVEDRPLSQVAAELNQRGYHTRAGREWTPGDLFMLLPRMIQLSPRLFSSEQWAARHQRPPRVI